MIEVGLSVVDSKIKTRYLFGTMYILLLSITVHETPLTLMLLVANLAKTK